MKEYAGISIRLGLICAVAALCLGLVNSITAPRIAWIRQMRLEQALKEVALGGSFGEFTEVKDNPGLSGFYELTYPGGAGMILSLKGRGYGGPMTIIASYSLDGTLLAAKLMENLETPGLGKEAERPDYMEMFTSVPQGRELPRSRSRLPAEQADRISGATITFLGVAEALHFGAEFVKRMDR